MTINVYMNDLCHVRLKNVDLLIILVFKHIYDNYYIYMIICIEFNQYLLTLIH